MCRINFIANFIQGSEHIATCTNFIEKFKHFHCKFQTSRRTRAPASTTPSSAGLDGAEEDQASIGLTGRRAKEDRRVGSKVGCGVPAVEADLGRADVV
jgi:hypothetical protein